MVVYVLDERDLSSSPRYQFDGEYTDETAEPIDVRSIEVNGQRQNEIQDEPYEYVRIDVREA